MDPIHALGLILVFLVVIQFNLELKNYDALKAATRKPFCHPYESNGYISNHVLFLYI